jgi:hypothetical protein
MIVSDLKIFFIFVEFVYDCSVISEDNVEEWPNEMVLYGNRFHRWEISDFPAELLKPFDVTAIIKFIMCCQILRLPR